MFNEPQILQSMVANSGITTYYTPNLYAYHLAFTGSQQGYAAALALVMARSRSPSPTPSRSEG